MDSPLHDIEAVAAPQPDMVLACFLADLRNRFRLGLPARIEARTVRDLKAEDLLNEDLDLGPFDHASVLSTMANYDPFGPNAMAAAARLLPRAVVDDHAFALAEDVGRVSNHPRVRESVGMAVREGLSPVSLAGMKAVAVEEMTAARAAARRALVSYLEDLAAAGRDPATLVDDLMMFNYRLDLPPAVFRKIVVTLVEGQRVPALVRARLVRDLHRLPRPLRLEVVTRVSLLPPDTHGNMAVKKALEGLMRRFEPDAEAASDETAKPTPRPAGRAPAGRALPWRPALP